MLLTSGRFGVCSSSILVQLKIKITKKVILSIYLLILRIDKGGHFFIRENNFTKGNRDWFGENNIPSAAKDVIFPKPAEIPWGKVIFPGKKITSRVNPQNE